MNSLTQPLGQLFGKQRKQQEAVHSSSRCPSRGVTAAGCGRGHYEVI